MHFSAILLGATRYLGNKERVGHLKIEYQQGEISNFPGRVGSFFSSYRKDFLPVRKIMTILPKKKSSAATSDPRDAQNGVDGVSYPPRGLAQNQVSYLIGVCT